MTAPSSRPAGVSFVVRLWLEQRDAAASQEWRFEVRHVQTGEQMHCRCLEDLLAFVERSAGVPGPELPAMEDHRPKEKRP